MEDNKRYQFNSNDLLFKVFSYRKIIVIIVGSAVVISAIVSFLITPKYESVAVLFPAPAKSISKSLIALQPGGEEKSLYGEDEEVEQVLQVLNSEEVKGKITKKYNLVKHYDLDPKDEHLKTKLHKEFAKNISFGRTQFMAIEIRVLDISPDTSALIANDIASTIDSVMNRMEKDRAVKAYEIVKDQYEIRRRDFELMSDSMCRVMQFGVYDIASQSGSLYREYGRAIIDGKTNAAKKIEEKLDILAKYGSKYIALENWIRDQSEQLSLLNTKLREAQVDAEQELTHVYIVDKAFAPDKKAYPQRILIVLITGVASLILAVILVFILEAIKDFKVRELAMKNQQ